MIYLEALFGKNIYTTIQYLLYFSQCIYANLVKRASEVLFIFIFERGTQMWPVFQTHNATWKLACDEFVFDVLVFVLEYQVSAQMTVSHWGRNARGNQSAVQG